MRMRDAEHQLDPEIAHDLAVIDRALVGSATDPGDSELAGLALLLRDERPGADPGWAAELDRRAAAGFPRGGGGSRLVPAWLRAGGWLAPAGAAAALLVLVVVAISTTNDGTGTGEPSSKRADGAGSGGLKGLREASGSVAGEASDAARFSRAWRDGGKIAPGTANRKVDRNTRLSLSAKPEDVRGVSDEVISITRSLGGVVASSRVSETPAGASATLQLTIPTRNLDGAVDRMTELANVDSLNEISDDITKPFVSAQDRVADAEARRRELLDALGNATTAAEADALTIKIADARREISRAQAAFERFARKARLSDLSVTVSSNPNASDERTLGDWLDAAVDVLRVVAGILLVSAAILVPLGLIGALAAWIVLRLRRRSRERTLG